MSTLYRLHTEANANLPAIVRRYFPGATLIPAVGLWEGTEEQSTIIEIIGTMADLRQVAELAAAIRSENNQQSVYVSHSDVAAFQSTADGEVSI